MGIASPPTSVVCCVRKRYMRNRVGYGFFMKNSLALLFLFSSVLLLIPTASAANSPATSTTLTSGTISLVGTVDVSNLPQIGQQTTNVNQAPLHSQGGQAYDQAKAQTAQNGYDPTGETAKNIATSPST